MQNALGSAALLTQALRERTLDAPVVDAFSLKPAPALQVTDLHPMRGAFLYRSAHLLACCGAGVTFEALRQHPIAATPLSDEVARSPIERCGPQAHPALCVPLQCDEMQSLVEAAPHSDAVLLAICAAAPERAELGMTPALNGVARFGLVTLRQHSAPPARATLRTLMRRMLRD